MTSNAQSTGPSAELAVHEEGRGTVVVEIHGELTRDTELDRFRSAVYRQCDDDRVSEVRVDLTETTAIDLQGLGALLTLRRECWERGATFVVDNPQGRVRSRLEQTGTLEYLRGGGRGHAPPFG
jgi:anti-anti-sigma factor